jgi:DNA-binding CsgD family transcriptional regulator
MFSSGKPDFSLIGGKSQEATFSTAIFLPFLEKPDSIPMCSHATFLDRKYCPITIGATRLRPEHQLGRPPAKVQFGQVQSTRSVFASSTPRCGNSLIVLAPMKTLLTKLQHQTGTTTYVSKLLAAFGTQVSGESRVSVVTLPHFPPEAFSQRELAILRLIQDGHSNQKISERLFLSLSTVKWHNQNIFAKLDVQRRTEAIARALELKLL